MDPYTYTRAQLEAEARIAVASFKRTLPAAIRRTARFDGWEIVIHDKGPTLAAYLADENGRHRVNIAI